MATFNSECMACKEVRHDTGSNLVLKLRIRIDLTLLCDVVQSSNWFKESKLKWMRIPTGDMIVTVMWELNTILLMCPVRSGARLVTRNMEIFWPLTSYSDPDLSSPVNLMILSKYELSVSQCEMSDAPAWDFNTQYFTDHSAARSLEIGRFWLIKQQHQQQEDIWWIPRSWIMVIQWDAGIVTKTVLMSAAIKDNK